MKPIFSRPLVLAAVLLIRLLPTSLQNEAQAVSPKTSPKVVVVSFDAAADWLVDDFLSRGVLPADGAFARMSRSGVRAEAMIPANVASTSPAHIAMFTGAYPERTGIVANSFLLPGDAVGRGSSGFNAPIKAETLWNAAMWKNFFCREAPMKPALGCMGMSLHTGRYKQFSSHTVRTFQRD